MDRIESIFEINPELQEIVQTGIKQEGSNLSGVSAKCWWEENYINNSISQHAGFPPGSSHDALTGKDVNTRFPVLPPIRAGPSFPKRESSDGVLSERRSACSSVASEISRTRTLRGVHLRFGLEAALLLPLALRGRLYHGRHFTFHCSSINEMAITFLTPKVKGSITDTDHKFAASGTWLQVLITDDFLQRLDRDLDELTRPSEIKLPREYRWPRYGIIITVLPDE